MTEHAWTGSGTGLGRRYDCARCGCTVFSYKEPLRSGMNGSVLLANRTGADNKWEVDPHSPDCDVEMVKGVMES